MVTIFALLVILGTVIARESAKAVRDVERKDEVGQFLLAAEAFKKDFGFYPNYSMVLGLGKNKLTSANYDLASPISVCSSYEDWAVGSDLLKKESNLNKAYLKPGFVSVSQFLQCLGYLKVVQSDPLWAGTVADYHYRVSNDAQRIIVQATTERSGVFLLGNGVGNKNLAEDSDTGRFASLSDRATANSRYLYQCLKSAEGKELSFKERVDTKFAPLIQDNSLNWIANPACEDKLASLLVVSSR